MGNFQIQFKHYQFSANLLPSLITIIMLPSLVSLGIWQLNRADQKRLVDKGVSTALIKTPLNINTFHSNDFSQDIYRKASLTGQYDNKHYLLDNRTYKGRAGFHVYTPFLMNNLDGAKNSQKAVLINRGWITYQGNRSNIPNIEASTSKTVISGKIKNIGKSIVLNNAKNDSSSFPKIIQSISLKQIAKDLDYQLLPIIIELDKLEDDGFTRDWKPYYGSVDKHIAYAVQWFSMAIVLFILFVKINTRKISP